MSTAVPGPMLVLDASCLVELVTDGPGAGAVRGCIAQDETMAAPHVVDVEVFGVIRRDHLRGTLDRTEALLALDRLAAWPGDRFPQTLLLDRAWRLRHTVRGWDAMYVALAEALSARLLTFDRRLAAADGPRCEFVVPGH